MSVHANNDALLKYLKEIQQQLASFCETPSPSFLETAKKVQILGEKIGRLETNLKSMNSWDAERELSSLKNDLLIQAALFREIFPFSIDPALGQTQTESPTQQLARIMRLSDDQRSAPIFYQCIRDRDPNEAQRLYTLVIEHPELLQGVVYDGQTFSMLCVQRGYLDLFERLLNEDAPMDLTTPMKLNGPKEPSTSTLNQLIKYLRGVVLFRSMYPEEYIEKMFALTKLTIKKHPNLLDLPLERSRTARQQLINDNLSSLIPKI